ncbi:p75 neurotrophin receptor-like protein precursor [Saccoglossus kowalevskii]|uniref:p75 neurotrophin receptor-like protein n=1 Tax=Saccoglossus kowalevskii TaxID=10224 RepID=D1LXA8_SACKO|nr:p75 neurotrophin receptor-like protein precursor [Saccoglossus kowalevskii]ACY92614.1 p75 neurotrophin receptor-like protein [Saccoglossus kowalevskii]
MATLHVLALVLCLYTGMLYCMGCPSESITITGECCEQCGPGTGVVQSCTGTNNTVCEQCETETTFSSDWSHITPCQQCSSCPTNMQVKIPCNATHDTVCECATNYYMNDKDFSCSQCDMCPAGYGAFVACGPLQNSVCAACGNGTYSDETSTMAECKQCAVCDMFLRACNELTNTVCFDESVYSIDSVTSSVSLTLTTGGEDSVNYIVDDSSSNVVPIYCSVLGAVIVGLLVYVACKRYKIWKNKQKHYKASRTSPVKGPPLRDVEMGKGHGSDSGVFTNTDNVSAVNGCARMPLMSLPSTTLFRDIAEDKKRQIELLLCTTRRDGRDWRALARELDFSDNSIMEFSNSVGKHSPVRKLLCQWSKRDNACLGLLVTSLHRIQRDDITKLIPIYVNLANVASLPS